jgi:hypothetical protein
MGEGVMDVLTFSPLGYMMEKAAPDIPELPPPVEELDVEGQKQLTRQRLKQRKGRRSTILASTANQGKKTVLG